MFSLSELNVKIQGSPSYTSSGAFDSFVGIKRNQFTKQLDFILPKNFDAFPTNDFEAIRRMFFRTYRTYRKFFEDRKRSSDSNTLDGFDEVPGGYRLVGKDETVATYSKLSVFDSVLEAYNELQILTLQNKLSKTNEINYSRIDKYLHRGIYLDDDAVFVDEVEIPKKIIDLDSPTLVQMFCYIYCEIQQALEETVDSPRTLSLAQEFREMFLGQDNSIFDQDTFGETLSTLRDALDDIDRYTAYKDEDYWHFYDAIYIFLYGENDYSALDDGTVWGLDNFAFIWEELCYKFAFSDEFNQDRILFADRFGKFEVQNGFVNPFVVHINGQHKRFLRPDLVVLGNDLIEEDFLQILDKIFRKEDIEIPWDQGVRVNMKLSPRFPTHSFNDLWGIYNKWVELNPSVKKHPEKGYYRNVAEQNVFLFIEELMTYFYALRPAQLINRKPLLYDFLVIDYKYVSESNFQNPVLSTERNHDITKQLVYEMALQSGYQTAATRSEFWIPTYFADDEDIYDEVDPVNIRLSSNGIKVVKISFNYLQELYLAK